MSNTLFLYLQGPLQSWGERAQWSERDTSAEPTKSGLVGLLGCALGWNTDEQLFELSRRIKIGVRCDSQGIHLVDYHTVGGGYDYPFLLTAEGKPKISSGGPHTELTWRTYLADSAFLIAVQSSEEWIDRLSAAVQAPVWPYFLGRKSCPPVRPLFDGEGTYVGLKEALLLHRTPFKETAADKSAAALKPIYRRIVIECKATTPNAIRRRNQVNSRSRRTFLPRYVEQGTLEMLSDKEEGSCTYPD